ncbi:3-demethylubiquinone-9 3-methyltransferase [Rugamonas rubra]|uniref:3-demethylubiquinone-9 3-methyltransferase n=1 Tax=Rugamonas rubra TaxID=758825 RepID=A0A1I4QHF7_9BURK|nr:3-demethylubiquinone-9 3-methyltransferase [Rugamonas rubra]
MKKNTICLWYEHDAEEAAHFYARTFPDSTVGAMQCAPSDFPGAKRVSCSPSSSRCVVWPASASTRGETAAQ